jgi:hypothetical protein
MGVKILPPREQAERMLARSRKTENGCLIPAINPNAKGYVYITRGRGVRLRAHRFIFKTLVKEISDDVLVRHTCDCRACINPAHLVEGSAADNSADMVERNRQARLGQPPTNQNDLAEALELKEHGHTLVDIAAIQGLSGPSSAADRVRRAKELGL